MSCNGKLSGRSCLLSSALVMITAGVGPRQWRRHHPTLFRWFTVSEREREIQDKPRLESPAKSRQSRLCSPLHSVKLRELKWSLILLYNTLHLYHWAPISSINISKSISVHLVSQSAVETCWKWVPVRYITCLVCTATIFIGNTARTKQSLTRLYKVNPHSRYCNIIEFLPKQCNQRYFHSDCFHFLWKIHSAASIWNLWGWSQFLM